MRNITDPSGKTWQVDEVARGSGAANISPGQKLPEHTVAMLQVTSGAAKFFSSVHVNWRQLDDAALWSQLDRGRKN